MNNLSPKSRSYLWVAFSLIMIAISLYRLITQDINMGVFVPIWLMNFIYIVGVMLFLFILTINVKQLIKYAKNT